MAFRGYERLWYRAVPRPLAFRRIPCIDAYRFRYGDYISHQL